ncbi:hypothetical protein ATANTOWER_002680 [Ataeniobius toweri]|uniref:Uncharacterized protein n=1 Tax=Ataeniobius toweri TaxID=208326 RepID=A0ABU7B783_9TELE|nr:hypothetical protein [Ataeniobius toweri]
MEESQTSAEEYHQSFKACKQGKSKIKSAPDFLPLVENENLVASHASLFQGKLCIPKHKLSTAININNIFHLKALVKTPKVYRAGTK